MVKPTPQAASDAWSKLGAAEAAVVNEAIANMLAAAATGRILDSSSFFAVLVTVAYVAAMTKRLQDPALGLAYGAGELQFIQRGCNLVSTWERGPANNGIENWRRAGEKDGLAGWGKTPYKNSTVLAALHAKKASPRFGFELRRNLSEFEAVLIRGKDWEKAYWPSWLTAKPPVKDGELPLRRGFLRWYGTFVAMGWTSALEEAVPSVVAKFEGLWFNAATAAKAPDAAELASWIWDVSNVYWNKEGFAANGVPLQFAWAYDPNETGVGQKQSWFQLSQQINAASTLGIDWPIGQSGTQFRTAAALEAQLRSKLSTLTKEAGLWKVPVEAGKALEGDSGRAIADQGALLPWMDLCYFRNPGIGGFVVEVSPYIPVTAPTQCYLFAQQLTAWARMVGWCLALWYRRLEAFPSSPLLAAQKAAFRPKVVLRFASEMNLGQEQAYGLRYDGKSPSPAEYRAAFKAFRAAVIAGFDKALELEGIETKAAGGTNWPHKASNVLEFAAVLNMTTHRPDVASDANNWKVLGHDGDTTVQQIVGPLVQEGVLGAIGIDLYGMMRNAATQAQEATGPIMHTPQAATLPVAAVGKAAPGLPLVVAEMGFQTLGAIAWEAIKAKTSLAVPGGAETSKIEGVTETLSKACYSGRWWLRAAHALLRATQLDLATSGAVLDGAGKKIAGAAPELRLLYFDVNKLLGGEKRDFAVTSSWQSVQGKEVLGFERAAPGWASLAATQDGVSWVQAETDWQGLLEWVRLNKKPGPGVTWRALVVEYFAGIAQKEGL